MHSSTCITYIWSKVITDICFLCTNHICAYFTDLQYINAPSAVVNFSNFGLYKYFQSCCSEVVNRLAIDKFEVCASGVGAVNGWREARAKGTYSRFFIFPHGQGSLTEGDPNCHYGAWNLLRHQANLIKIVRQANNWECYCALPKHELGSIVPHSNTLLLAKACICALLKINCTANLLCE
jgi:hypothetical protein